MRRNWFNKIRKAMALGLVTVMTMVSTIAPVLADELVQPQISQWSIGTLNEGENYGIYPIGWYQDGFLEGISTDKLSVLLANVETKLSKLELEKDEAFTPITCVEDGSRGSVLTSLYNSVASYKLPGELENDKGDAIEYMQARNILSGTSKGLELDADCTVEQAVVFATGLIEDTYDAAEAGSKGLMWEVNNEGNTVYLLGSIHIGDTNLYPMHKTIKETFAKSDVLIVEACDLNPESEEELMQIGMCEDGRKLPDYLSEKTYTQYTALLEQIGLPTDVFDDFKPWFVALQLNAIATSSSGSLEEATEAALLGIDNYFLTTGMLTGKPVAELEGIMYQANLFNDLSPEMQEEYFEEILYVALNPESEGALESGKLLDQWFKQWSEGDIDGFADSYIPNLEEDQSELDEMLLGKRDQDMADKLAELLEEDGESTYFVVVGALHLATEGMVVDQLENKGYVVERFWE